MAHSRSAIKRIRQNARRRARGRIVRSRLRTELKKLFTLAKGGDAAKAQTQLRLTMKLLDKAAHGGTIHRNKASRHKSQIHARVAAMTKKV